MVQLVQVVPAREDGPVTQHLTQNTAHRPDVDRLGVALPAHEYIAVRTDTLRAVRTAIRINSSSVTSNISTTCCPLYHHQCSHGLPHGTAFVTHRRHTTIDCLNGLLSRCGLYIQWIEEILLISTVPSFLQTNKHKPNK